MKIGIRVKIDVKKIEKARLYQGTKGTYLDATVFIEVDQKDQYGNNGMITQDVSKEERQQGIKGAILGNVEVFFNDSQSQAPQQNYQQAPQQQPQNNRQQSPNQNIPPANQYQQNQQSAPPCFEDYSDDIPF
jgi:transcription initiation factor TFIID subunit TAF12